MWPRGIRATAAPKEAQLRCIYSDAGSTGDKQELEATVWLESCDTVTIRETWRDGSQLECCGGWLPTYPKRGEAGKAVVEPSVFRKNANVWK